MPFLQQMNGLRRNVDAMKVDAGTTIIFFKLLSGGKAQQLQTQTKNTFLLPA